MGTWPFESANSWSIHHKLNSFTIFGTKTEASALVQGSLLRHRLSSYTFILRPDEFKGKANNSYSLQNSKNTDTFFSVLRGLLFLSGGLLNAIPPTLLSRNDFFHSAVSNLINPLDGSSSIWPSKLFIEVFWGPGAPFLCFPISAIHPE